MVEGHGLRRAGGKHLSPVGSSRLLQQIQAEVLEHLEEHAAAAAFPEAPTTAPNGWLAAAMATWILFAALLLWRPSFARGPQSHPTVVPTAQREASLRYGVWLANGAVQRFIVRNSRLPSFLNEAGVSDTTIQLRVTGERSYELVGSEGDASVTLASGASADLFLGESVRALQSN